MALRFSDPRILSAALQVRWLGPQYEDGSNALPIGRSTCSSISRVARRLVQGLEAFVTVENLFDRNYLVRRASVDTRGRPFSIFGGLRFAL